MADRVQYLGYSVYMSSKEEAENYQAAYPNGVNVAPDTLAAQLGYPIVLSNVTTPFSAPSIRSPFFTPTSKYPRNVDSFEICRGGWFGICALFGRNTTYKWVAKYYYSGPAVPTQDDVPVPVPDAMQQRSWIDGFEMESGTAGFGAWGTTGAPVTRAASRHVEGYGYAYRGQDDVGEYFEHSVNEHGAPNRLGSWERIYHRPRRVPSSSALIWYCRGGGAEGAQLEVTPSLSFALYNVSNLGVRTLIGASTAAMTLNEWHKLDLVFSYGTGGSGGYFKLYLKGVKILDLTIANASGGIGSNSGHGSSRLGLGDASVIASDYEGDFDDWMCATIPTNFNGLDWLNGSKIAPVLPTGFAAANTWGGDWRALLRNPFRGNTLSTTSRIANSVAGSTLAVTTDADYTIDKCVGALGCIAMRFRITGTTATDTTQLGYKIAGGAVVTKNFTEANFATNVTNRVHMYRPSGLISTFNDVTPMEFHYIRGVSAVQIFAHSLTGEAELVGVFGDEDVIEESHAVTAPPPPRLGPHNGPYPRSVWARQATPPTAPVIVIAGTYTGNGTAQDLTFRAPVNFFHVRKQPSLGGTEAGTWWWSSLVAAHAGGGQGVNHEGMIQAAEDVTFVPIGGVNDPEERYVIRISGSAANCNAAASVYQYIAVIDPGARFMLNGVEMHHSSVTSAVNTLKNALFQPEGMFTFNETPDESGAIGLGFKGPGNTSQGLSRFGSAELATALQFGVGQFTTLANTHIPENTAFGYSAWRTNDGSGDANVAKVVKIGSYTGNGSATRTIGLSPASGLRPLWAIVVPSSATVAIRRDPSNTGTISTDTTGTDNAATGIISGDIDAFTVGSALNTNGTVYNYFVLMGSATAGNGGWSVNGEFAYVEPDYNGDFPIVEPPVFDEEPPVTDPDPDPGPDDEDDCNDGEVCVAATTRNVNLALMALGSSNVLTNYCTQDTREAVLAREVYEQSVRHTLIAYSWPFATKYANLSLTAAQPSNQDWTYAYRMPADCIFPRRIVVARGTAVDPSPPPMGLSSDASGGIIFANEANAVLEYTARPACVGYNGDDLFLEALKWRLAAALAPALTRIPGEEERCLKMFEITVQKAEATVKQGVPGLRGAASTLDTTAAAIAANIQVVNMALVKIGSRTIANLATEQTREAVAANLVFEDVLRSVLRDFPWAFATRYVDPATLVDGAEGDPVTPDWTYAHRLPDDFVYLRRLVVEGTGRSFEAEPEPFRIASDTTGGLLYSNVEEPIIEYTARLQNILVYADPLFREALSWKLASTLAPSLASVELHRPEQHGRGPETPQDPTRRSAMRFQDQSRRVSIAQWANAMYEKTLIDAQVADRNESQAEPQPDAPWITGR